MEHISNIILNKYLENELSETEFIFVENHLKECSQCRKEIEFNRILFSKLKNEALIIPSSNFSDTVMKAVLKTAKPKFNWNKIFNSQNGFIFFFSSVIGLYSLIYIFFDDKETKKSYLMDFITPYYKKAIDYLYTTLEPLQKHINLLFQKEGLYYFFLGIAFIILFLLFDKFIVEKKPKQKSIGTFLV